jgi:mycoredoxin
MSGDSRNEILVYTTAWCSACWRAKQVMDAMRVNYTEIDISYDEEAAERVMALNRGYRSVPTIIFPDGSHLTEPLTTELMKKLEQLANSEAA